MFQYKFHIIVNTEVKNIFEKGKKVFFNLFFAKILIVPFKFERIVILFLKVYFVILVSKL